jgi:hypothetical protein
MSSQLPPPPEGRISGFPYSILWEEFAQIWEELDRRRDPEEQYEALIAKAAPLELCLTREPSRLAIQEIIQPLELPDAAAEHLAAELYRIAAAYRIPQLKKALGLGATATKSHLAKVAAAAAKLAGLLESTPLEQEVVIGLLRKHVDPKSQKPLFNFKELINETSKLASAATMIVDEIPQMPRGTSANILKARLMEAVTRAIGESAAEYLEVLQADAAGRNPRPKSRSAHVLFAYLKLVEPALTNTAIVRLFAGHNCGPKLVTIEEIEDLPPKSWPHHVARRKLTR